MKVVIKVPPNSARLQVTGLVATDCGASEKLKLKFIFKKSTGVSSRFVSLNVCSLIERKSVLMIMGR